MCLLCAYTRRMVSGWPMSRGPAASGLAASEEPTSALQLDTKEIYVGPSLCTGRVCKLGHSEYCRTRVLARPQWLPSLVERAVTATPFEF